MPLITSEKQLEKIWGEMPERFGFAENVETFWRKYKCWPEHYFCKRILNKIHSAFWQFGLDYDHVKTFRNGKGRIITIPYHVSAAEIKSKTAYKELPIWLDMVWDIDVFPASEINVTFSTKTVEANVNICTMVLTEKPKKKREKK